MGQQRIRLEAYLKETDLLGNVQTVSPELILAEYQARLNAGETPDLTLFAKRFPEQLGQLRQLIAECTFTAMPAKPPEAERPTHSQAGVHTAMEVTPQESEPTELPKQLGKYNIRRFLAQGGMGAVYKAYDPTLDRHVAIKVPHPEITSNRAAMERFDREAKAVAALDHPNICSVYEVGKVNGIHFLAMAYIKGEDLRRYIDRNHPLDPQQVASAMYKLARAMQTAHEKGVLHRDLKPSNIRVARGGELKIMDFGLAKRVDQQQPSDSQTGQMLGTPMYMAPEQAEGRIDAIGPATDIYGLGAVMYQMLTGQPPFSGKSIHHIASAVIDGDVTPPSQVFEDVDPRLESICLKAMAKAIEDRYASMAQFAAVLQEYLNPSQPPEPPPVAARRHGLWILLLSAIATMSIAIPLGIFANRESQVGLLPAESERLSEDDGDRGRGQTSNPRQQNHALSFDGNSVVKIPSLRFLGEHSITLEAFVSTQKEGGLVIGNGQVNGLSLAASDSEYAFHIRHDDDYSDRAAKSPVIAGQEFVHVAAVWDKNKNQMRLYVNGELADTNSRQGRYGVSPYGFCVGASPRDGTHADHFFHGMIDEIRISKVARYSGDSFRPTERFETDKNTLCLLHFEESKGSKATDASGNGHDGEITGARWEPVAQEEQLRFLRRDNSNQQQGENRRSQHHAKDADYAHLLTGEWKSLMDDLFARVDGDPKKRIGRAVELNGNGGWVAVGAAFAKDVIIRASVQLNSGRQPQINLGSGLGWHYGVYWSSRGGKIGVGKKVNGRWRDLATHPLRIRKGQFYEWVFAAIGNDLTVYIDGTKVLSHTETVERATGGVSFGALEAVATFRDVEVMILDEE